MVKGSGSSQSNNSDREQMGDVGRIPMETTVEVREDLPEELAESNWSMKAGYEWVAADVRTQYFIFLWSQARRSHFYTSDGSTKFPFFWTGNP